MKKFSTVVVTLCVCAAALVGCGGQQNTNSADEAYTVVTKDDLTYRKYSDHIYIQKCKSFDEAKPLPSHIEDLPVTVIGQRAFTGCKGTGTLVIPDTVTTIEDYAFLRCNEAEAVTVPNSVKTIGKRAFSKCKELKSAKMPENVDSLAYGTFYGCEKLEEVTLPKNITAVVDSMFSHCKVIKAIDIPESVTAIEYRAFENCKKLESIDIPKNVTTIGENAFFRCGTLSSVTIPENVQTIEDKAFASCGNLTEINVSDKNSSFCSSEGILFNKDKTELICCPANIDKTEYTIPDSVDSIGEYAFISCKNLTAVNIPKNVSSIERLAFYDCPALTTLTINSPDCAIDDSFGTVCSSYTAEEGYSFTGNICGSKDSTAQEYAEKCGYQFSVIGS